MQGDSGTEPHGEVESGSRRDIWRLPDIRRLDINYVRYERPLTHTRGGKTTDHEAGIEIAVETDAEIPIRALSPALHIGTAEVAENERTGERSYRFFVLDPNALEAGAPIALGWVGHPAPERASQFRYEPPADAVRERARPG